MFPEGRCGWPLDSVRGFTEAAWILATHDHGPTVGHARHLPYSSALTCPGENKGPPGKCRVSRNNRVSQSCFHRLDHGAPVDAARHGERASPRITTQGPCHPAALLYRLA